MAQEIGARVRVGQIAAAVYGGDLWTTDDSGKTWSDQKLAKANYLSAISSSSDGTHLAAVHNGGDIWTY